MTVSEFVDTYYKHDRLHREKETRERLIASKTEDIELYGYTVISHHDNNQGITMILYNGEVITESGKQREIIMGANYKSKSILLDKKTKKSMLIS